MEIRLVAGSLKKEDYKEKACPCANMIRVSAESIANEFSFAMGNIIDEDIGERFLDILNDMCDKEGQIDFAIELLHIMLKLLAANHSTILMESIDFNNPKNAKYFMNTFLDSMQIELFVDDEED